MLLALIYAATRRQRNWYPSNESAQETFCCSGQALEALQIIIIQMLYNILIHYANCSPKSTAFLNHKTAGFVSKKCRPFACILLLCTRYQREILHTLLWIPKTEIFIASKKTGRRRERTEEQLNSNGRPKQNWCTGGAQRQCICNKEIVKKAQRQCNWK